MNARDVIYELIQGELEHRIFIYDPILKTYYQVSKLEVDDNDESAIFVMGKEVKA